jgi:hypothetical protein
MVAAADRSRDWVRRKRQTEQDLHERQVSLEPRPPMRWRVLP